MSAYSNVYIKGVIKLLKHLDGLIFPQTKWLKTEQRKRCMACNFDRTTAIYYRLSGWSDDRGCIQESPRLMGSYGALEQNCNHSHLEKSVFLNTEELKIF